MQSPINITPELKSLILSVTTFLDNGKKIPIRQRLWHYDNNIHAIPKCKICNINEVSWSEGMKQYRTYCSSKCAHNSPSVRQKTEKTCLERYGETTNLKSTLSNDKKRRTLIEKYGVDNPFKSSTVQEKIKKTNLEKYGYENPSKSPEVKAKIDSTNYTKYGRKRQSQTHLDMATIVTKNDEKLMRHWFEDLKMPITEIAEVLGVNHSQLTAHFVKNLNIDTKRHSVSTHERRLREFIQQHETNVIFNDRTILKPKELDIVLPDRQLAIELHGLAWHGERMGKGSNYHYDKFKKCQNSGYELIQITDLEYISKPDIVKSRLLSRLGNNTRVFARKCKVQEISHDYAASFLDSSHIQGSCVSSIRLGLYYDDELLACMTFGKSRFNKKYEYELLRYASKPYVNVIGGAGKLFSYFVDAYSPNSIISYCDLRWGTGNMYLNLGFEHERETGPNYWYVYKGRSMETRMKYQKHKLDRLLENFNPDLTEKENMVNHGYDRFWDCGNNVFLWNRKK